MQDIAQIMLLCETRGGGTLRHVVDLYAGLKEHGWNVTVVITPPEMYPEFGSELQSISESDRMLVPMRRSPHPSDLNNIRQIRKRIVESSLPTILHAHSTKAGLLGVALRPWCYKTLYTPHAFRSIDPTLGRVKAKAIRLAEKHFAGCYDRVIAVAPAELDYALAMGLKQERLRYIPNGIRSNTFISSENGKSSINQGGPCLGFVGRLDDQKNPLLFIDVLRGVASRIAGARAIVVGDGRLMESMVQYAETCGVGSRIEWRGSVPAGSTFREIDVLVHTSQYEAMPYTLLEAAASQVPIVATRNHGSVAILEEFLPGAISKSFAPEDLVEIVASILQDTQLAARHRERLKAIAERYSLEKMVSAIGSEYSALLEEGVRPIHFVQQHDAP